MKVKVINRSSNLLPEYKTSGSAGMDVMSNQLVVVGAGKIVAVSTGLFVEIPEGNEIQVRSRSGLALKGIVVNNAPGTIDSDFRGELKVIIKNQTKTNHLIQVGDRIAQLVFAKVEKCEWEETTEELSTTERGEGGFGSTGISTSSRYTQEQMEEYYKAKGIE